MSDIETSAEQKDAATPLLEVRNLVVRYGKKATVNAVDDVSFTIARGETVASSASRVQERRPSGGRSSASRLSRADRSSSRVAISPTRNRPSDAACRGICERCSRTRSHP